MGYIPGPVVTKLTKSSVNQMLTCSTYHICINTAIFCPPPPLTNLLWKLDNEDPSVVQEWQCHVASQSCGSEDSSMLRPYQGPLLEEAFMLPATRVVQSSLFTISMTTMRMDKRHPVVRPWLCTTELWGGMSSSELESTYLPKKMCSSHIFYQNKINTHDFMCTRNLNKFLTNDFKLTML